MNNDFVRQWNFELMVFGVFLLVTAYWKDDLILWQIGIPTFCWGLIRALSWMMFFSRDDRPLERVNRE